MTRVESGETRRDRFEHLPKKDGIFRVVAWNMLFKARLEPDKLKSISPDVLCLQEVSEDSRWNPGINTARALGEILGMNVFYRPHRIRGGGGSAILSVGDHASTREETLHQSRTVARYRRIYQEAEVALPDGSHLTVGLAHLMTPISLRSDRKKQIDLLTGIVSDKTERYLLVGDFNAGPDSSYLSALLQLGGLENCGPDFTVPTWSSELLTRRLPLGGIGKYVSRRLDYALATPDVAKAVETVHLLDPYPSDHNPLAVDIEYANL